MPVVNGLLWNSSYAYACWRVTHPFGPDVSAFGYVARKTEPDHIPFLIAKLDTPDYWWIEELLLAWFPEVQPPEEDSGRFWREWWADHQHEYGSLVLQHDPAF